MFDAAIREVVKLTFEVAMEYLFGMYILHAFKELLEETFDLGIRKMHTSGL